KISTWNIGGEFDVKQWRSVYRQLVSLGYLQTDVDGHGGLALTEQCRPILKGETHLLLRKDVFSSSKSKTKSQVVKHSLSKEEEPLWNALREKRTELAKEHNYPPYIIFQDATLVEMVRHRPETLTEMNMLTGIGQKKLEQYGQIFLEVVNAFSDDSTVKIPLTYTPDYAESQQNSDEMSLQLFLNGLDIDEIAQKRNILRATIVNHLSKAIENGTISSIEVVDIEEKDMQLIEDTILSQDDGVDTRLKPVFEFLDGVYDYDTIKCVRAGLAYQLNQQEVGFN
ncbi:MAG: ATP-dependent DNA helicase RecQ, partial [Methylococcales bacterium]|nr:ATP-dependent DNA helicase RecQ [Methylococcales bacterium]